MLLICYVDSQKRFGSLRQINLLASSITLRSTCSELSLSILGPLHNLCCLLIFLIPVLDLGYLHLLSQLSFVFLLYHFQKDFVTIF